MKKLHVILEDSDGQELSNKSYDLGNDFSNMEKLKTAVLSASDKAIAV